MRQLSLTADLQARGSTFEAQLDPYSKVIIGDEDASYFRPHLALDRWGGESRLSFGIDTTKRITPIVDGSKVEWTDGDHLHRFYLLPPGPGREYGGVEYEWVLGAHPGVRALTLPFDIAGLEGFYQVPMAQATGRLRTHGVRPPTVEGSWAFYHPSCGQVHAGAARADKYKTGKAFHLYRPEAIDAKGVRWWVDLTLVAGQMGLVIGPEFAAATYPVTIDPTIGYTSLGGSSDTTEDYSINIAFAAPEAGGATPGTAFIGGHSGTGTAEVYAGVYVYNAAGPFNQARLAASSVITLQVAPAAFRSAAITWASITATNYILSVWSNTTNARTSFDSAGATGWFRQTTAASPPDPFPDSTGSGSWNNRASIYIDYTAAGGAAAPKRLLTLGVGSVVPLYPAWWRWRRMSSLKRLLTLGAGD